MKFTLARAEVMLRQRDGIGYDPKYMGSRHGSEYCDAPE